MKTTILILSVVLTSLTIFMMTAKVNAQNTDLKAVSLTDTQVDSDEFKKFVEVPKDYLFYSVSKVKVDSVSAYLFRFEKQENKGLGGEHFSFLISENKQI